jgi:acyl carrier protein
MGRGSRRYVDAGRGLGGQIHHGIFHAADKNPRWAKSAHHQGNSTRGYAFNRTGAIHMEDMKGIILGYVIKEYSDDDSEPITFETPLISGGIVDSFSMVSLKRFLENKYQIQIPDDKATPEAFDSVNKIASLVEEFLQKKG